MRPNHPFALRSIHSSKNPIVIGFTYLTIRQNVATVLLHRGRLSFQQIVRYTRIKPRTVRTAILVLVQQNILWHAQTEDEGEVLEFNTMECLMRLRFGRYIWLAEHLFGTTVRVLAYPRRKTRLRMPTAGLGYCTTYTRSWQTSPTRYRFTTIDL